MTNNKEEINIIWLKRDLRLNDNEAITNARKSKKKILFLYVFEKILINNPHYSERHWNFIKESIRDLNKNLHKYNTKVLAITSDITAVFNQLSNKYKINSVFSHQETGLLVTYNRDKEFKRYCRNNEINWVENTNNGVLRGLLNDDNWLEKWENYMLFPQHFFSTKDTNFTTIHEIDKLSPYFNITNLETKENKTFQKGGTTSGWNYADIFFKLQQTAINNISNTKAPQHFSRLSPYISWGNISIREIFQRAIKEKENTEDKRLLNLFLSRIRWQAEFIQQFEMESTMENASIEKGYQKLKKNISDEYIKAWKEGKTGFPIIDASMKCLNKTGYLNVRKRSMVVSFFSNALWQPWQAATHHLSQMFLDFEPGIHFSQLQIQAKTSKQITYSTIKNNAGHDADIRFIIKWLPELANLSVRFVQEPYLMTSLDQQLNKFILGKDYPLPIVELRKYHGTQIKITF